MGHTVLVVVDDDPRRDATARALVAAGLQVSTAADAGEALELLSRNPRAVRLVVADLDVEPIGGFNLARAIHRRWTSIPVAIVGEATRTMTTRARAAGVVLLPRDAAPDHLAGAITKLLGTGNLALSLAMMSESSSGLPSFVDEPRA